jgi:hypothetical protein
VHGACTLDVIARAAASGLAGTGAGDTAGGDFIVATDARIPGPLKRVTP